jgi:hypothetical protein
VQGELIFTICKVIFARNLNQAGAIDMLTPDAKRIRGHLLALGWFNAATGERLIFATLKDRKRL